MDDRAKELNARIEDLRSGCHATYNGGHHDEPAYSAFHHGMDTICNVLAGGWLSAYGDEREREALNLAAEIASQSSLLSWVGGSTGNAIATANNIAAAIRDLIKESK